MSRDSVKSRGSLCWRFRQRVATGFIMLSIGLGWSSCRQQEEDEDPKGDVDLEELLSHGDTGEDGGAAEGVGAHSPPEPKGKTQVVMLGTGTPAADPSRAGPGVAVVVGKRSYLVDCGAGVVRRAAAAAQLGFKALLAKNLRRVFLTHLHSDHTVGLPDLWLSPWVLGRTAPLEIYGPPGTRNLAKYTRRAYRADVQVRQSGPEPANPVGKQILATEVLPGLIYRDEHVRVQAFRVKHGRWRHAYGYRFQTQDRVIVVSGDTVPTETVVKACNGCDVLVHEVYSSHGAKRLLPSRRAYHRMSHTSAYELAELAKRARPKLLVLYHQLLWGVSETRLLGEIQAYYPGPVVSAEDLDVF